MLNQCVSVLQHLSEFVKSEPELQARLQHVELPLSSSTEVEVPDRGQRGCRGSLATANEKLVKENVPPARISRFAPGSNSRYETMTPNSAASVPHFHLERTESVGSAVDGLPSSKPLRLDETSALKQSRRPPSYDIPILNPSLV